MPDLTVKSVVTWLWVKQPGKVVKAGRQYQLVNLQVATPHKPLMP
jgi:hypothetical protein